jgi:hypothetical protein
VGGVARQSISGLRKKSEYQAKSAKNVPLGLKPCGFYEFYGTAEAVPFQSTEFFRGLLFFRSLLEYAAGQVSGVASIRRRGSSQKEMA